MVRMNFIFIPSSDPTLLRKKSNKQKIKNDGIKHMNLQPDWRHLTLDKKGIW